MFFEMNTKKQFKVHRKPVPSPMELDQCKPLTLGLRLQKSLVTPKHSSVRQCYDEPSHDLKIKLQEIGNNIPHLEPHGAENIPQTPEQSYSPEIPHIGTFRGGRGLRQLIQHTDSLELSGTLPPVDEISQPSSSPASGKTPPPFGPLLKLKVSCALCLDPNMLRLNGTELQCGHFVHGSCLRDTTQALSNDLPLCAYCGVPCERVFQGGRKSRICSSVYSTMPPESLAAVGEDLVATACDVEPLIIRSYAHPTSSDTYELLVQVTANKGVSKSHWKHVHTADEESALKRLATDAIGVTQLAGRPISQQEAGSIRLVSQFRSNGFQVTAYLFSRYIIMIRHSNDGFEELMGIVDLQSEETEVYAKSEGLILSSKDDTYELAAERSVVSIWISAINDLSLKFPILDADNKLSMQLDLPLWPGYAESVTLDFVVCMPVARVELVVPLIISQLGPQDRLGLVIVLADGACAWLAPHKPTWTGWTETAHFDVETCRHFTPASSDLLNTAIGLFGENQNVTRQKSIAVVSGCPVSSTAVLEGITLHTIGYGHSYDLELLTRLSRSSTNGKFYHAESLGEIDSCLAGLAAADRTYVHHNVNLLIELRGSAVLTGAIGQSSEKHSFPTSQLKCHLGSLMAGQSRSVLLELSAKDMRPADIIAECEVQSQSAITYNHQFRQCWARVGMGQVPDIMFFDRLTRISTDILRDGLQLAKNNNISALYALLGRTAIKIDDAAKERSLVEPIGSTVLQFNNPDSTDKTMVVKAQFLAAGLRDLQSRVLQFSDINITSLTAMLYESAHILEIQCAVTSRSAIERVFFERLDSNRI